MLGQNCQKNQLHGLITSSCRQNDVKNVNFEIEKTGITEDEEFLSNKNKEIIRIDWLHYRYADKIIEKRTF